MALPPGAPTTGPQAPRGFNPNSPFLDPTNPVSPFYNPALPPAPPPFAPPGLFPSPKIPPAEPLPPGPPPPPYPDPDPSDPNNFNQIGFQVQCFAAGTPILLADGSQEAIENITAGQSVMAFNALGQLVPRRVVRLFRNVTAQWIELSFEGNIRKPLVVTPGHSFLAKEGSFEEIGELLKKGAGCAHVVLEDGSLAVVRGRLIAYNEGTAHLFAVTSIVETGQSLGALALAPSKRSGWLTYNFEVEELHTYIAGGVRVHNDSTGPTSSP